MIRRQKVNCLLIFITLVQLPSCMLFTSHQMHSRCRTDYKLPDFFSKKVKCGSGELFLLKCAITCQEMSDCYMFCFNSTVCAIAQLGNGYTIFINGNNDQCRNDDSMTYTCYNNTKMNIASDEERLFALDVSNVALGKPAKVMKEYQPANGPSSVFLVDGSLSRIYTGNHKECVDSAMEDRPWVWIDLQEIYDVLAINITNNDDSSYKKRFHDAEIRIGMNGDTSPQLDTYFENNPTCFNYTRIGDDYWTEFCHPGPISGRYVTLQLTKKCSDSTKCHSDTSNVINICEMQVFVLNK